MEETDTKALLNQIFLLIDTHDQCIKDSGTLIDNLELNIQNKLKNQIKCNYDLDLQAQDGNKTPKIEWKIDPETLTTEDHVYRALALQIKNVVHSSDKTVTATGSASELVKKLVDLFLSSVDNPTKKTDGEILEFVMHHKAEIKSFVDKDCKQTMLSCLVDKIEEERLKNDLIYASMISSEMDKNVAKPVGVEKTKEKTMSEEEKLQQNLQLLNNTVQSQFTDLVIDQIEGFEEISQNISSDPKKTEAFTIVKSKYLDEKEKEDKLLEKIGSPKDEQLKIDKTKSKPKNLQKSQMFDKLMDLSKPHLQPMVDHPNTSELVRALDAALVELEKDIRGRLFEKDGDRSTTKNSKYSLVDNLAINSFK